jgi:hypothetical protein
MESGRMLDPAGQAWRRQAHGDHARGGETRSKVLVYAADTKRDWGAATSCINPQQNASSGNNKSRGRFVHFKAL